MSSKYSITPEEAKQGRLERDLKQDIQETIRTTISAKYKEFILLQYQLHCDEYDASDIIVASAEFGRDTDASFLQHCRERKIYCKNEMMLIATAYPEMYNARYAIQMKRI